MLYGYVMDSEHEAYWEDVFKNDDKRIVPYPMESLGDAFCKQQGIEKLSSIEKTSIFYCQAPFFSLQGFFSLPFLQVCFLF